MSESNFNEVGYTKADIETLIFYLDDFVPNVENVTLSPMQIEMLIDALEYYKEDNYY